MQGGKRVWARGLIRSEDKMLLRIALKHDFFCCCCCCRASCTDEQPEEYRGRRNSAAGKGGILFLFSYPRMVQNIKLILEPAFLGNAVEAGEKI